MRLLVHVEGQTEETFVNEVLGPYLIEVGYSSVSARLLGNSRMRARRGGITSWSAVKVDISNHLKQDHGAAATTIVDFYALPSGQNGWPGRLQAGNAAFDRKASIIENAVQDDLANYLGPQFDRARFIPYVAMHEFEGLLFSDCKAFAKGVGDGRLAEPLSAIRGAFHTPEHINDSPLTAPSKRVAEIFPAYQKALHGPLAALEMGIDVIRAECLGFDRWIERLIAFVQ